jgi:hypothetical protein
VRARQTPTPAHTALPTATIEISDGIFDQQKITDNRFRWGEMPHETEVSRGERSCERQ